MEKNFFGDLGVDYRCAVADASLRDPAQERVYSRWLSEGNAAGMDWMRRHEELRKDPRNILPGVRSIIVLAFPFPLGPRISPIAAYAQGNDYHDELRKLLRPRVERLQERLGGEWRICVDSAPLAERSWGLLSGLGKRTRSGMLWIPGLGTACFLCEILTTIPPATLLKESELSESQIQCTLSNSSYDPNSSYKSNSSYTSVCETCDLCEKACPAGALHSGLLDARRCLSYLTIEHRGPWVEETMRQAMETPAGRETLFGCDRCVRICPLNRGASNLRILDGLRSRPEIAALDRNSVGTMDSERFSLLFRGSPVKRAKLEGLRRNAGVK